MQAIEDEIVDQYLYADDSRRPWIIGFSGGKDSTVMLQLVWNALKRIKEFHGIAGRDIYVVCNDTMVENPVITEYVYRILDKISLAAVEQDLPIYVKKTIPRLEDSFWVNLIGKGYPAPNNSFRWCTERLKIKPTSRFILEQVDEFGEAVILIGTRSSESANRAKSMKKYAIKGKRLSKHPTQSNTYVYAPIRHLMLEEVWYIINTMPSPWGASNEELFQIYSDASADDYECPTVVTDKEHKSCGQSRFGCWVCTVVKEDKSMSALIENGLTWLKPLLNLRNELAEDRNIIENRMPQRRNGTEAVNGMGPYKLGYRESILEKLLLAQKEIQENGRPHVLLITNQELIAIQAIWVREHYWNFKRKSVSQIYNSIYTSDLDMKDQNEKKEKELELLKKSCEKNPQDFELIQELLTLQKNKSLLNRKRGLKEDIETRIEEYLKKEKKDVH